MLAPKLQGPMIGPQEGSYVICFGSKYTLGMPRPSGYTGTTTGILRVAVQDFVEVVLGNSHIWLYIRGSAMTI